MRGRQHRIWAIGIAILLVLASCRNVVDDSSAPLADSTPPADPTEVAAHAEFGRVTLTWTDPSDDDLAKVEIVRTPGPETPHEVLAGVQGFAATGTTEGTEYTFTLRAFDTTGNASPGQSVAVTAPPSGVTEITASNGSADDEFGVSVAIDGDFAIVGAEDFPSNDRDGIVYLFERDADGNWSEEAFFDRTGTGDGLGDEVEISGSTAAAIAPEGRYTLMLERGAGGGWSEGPSVAPSGPVVTDDFGRSIGLSGDYLFVGAPRDDHAGSSTGAAYIFERSSGVWPATETVKLVASDASAGDQFGASVAVSGTYAVVGAPYRAEAGPRVPGAVYVFERDSSGTWNEVAILTTSEPVTDLELGRTVAIDGGTIAASSPNYSEVASFAGAVFVFERDSSGSWRETQRIEPSDLSANDRFGASIDISGNTMVIGSQNGDTSAVTDSGTAYVYRRTAGGVWFEITELAAPNPEAGSDFGGAVSVSGTRGLVGADRASPNATSEMGEAYVFE